MHDEVMASFLRGKDKDKTMSLDRQVIQFSSMQSLAQIADRSLDSLDYLGQ